MRHGSNLDPPNRFSRIHSEPDLEHLEWDTEYVDGLTNRKIEYLEDKSASIVSENRSPDINFRYSVNPYRGCVHACSYCYARPTHEYLGFNAGLDFETKIMVKHDAPELLREFLAKKSWSPELIAFSGVTDCYQPAERKFKITRRCLEVARDANQPIGIVTKNALVVRDIDILKPMAEKNLVRVSISLTTLEPELARTMEPRTSIPSARLRTIRELTKAGIPTRVLVAPVIPGLNDSEIPTILQAAHEAGAVLANFVMLRLPLTVEPVFLEWLERTRPEQKDRIISRVRQCRQGNLNNSEFGSRMRGTGEIADQINRMFKIFAKQFGLDQTLPPLDCDLFVPPTPASDQQRLF